MAIFKNSTFGTMRKSIGDDVAYRMGGQNIVRKKPAYVNDAKTKAQIEQRTALALIVALYRSVSVIVRSSFVERLSKHSAFNVFTSVNLRNAIQVLGGNVQINFTKLLFSKGSLPLPASGSVSLSTGGGVAISLNQTPDNISTFPNDNLNIIAVEGGNKAQPVHQRVALSASGTIPTNKFSVDSGQTWWFYAYITSSNGAKSSDSIYIGKLSK